MDATESISLAPEWRARSRSWGHPFHSMCNSMAEVPPRIAHYFIQKFTRPGDVVLDPFSGRGATPLQACAENRIGIGVDRAPLGWLLTAAQVDPPDKTDLLRRIEDLETDMFYGEVDNEPEDIRLLFHDYTLGQLVYLKGILDTGDRCDRFILATLAGAVRGAARGGGKTRNYLTIQIPNTHSLSPDAIRDYVKRHNPPRMKIDAFEVLRRRVERLFRDGPPLARGRAWQGDHLALRETPDPALKRRQASLIVTSPPHPRAARRGPCDRIRIWLLNTDLEKLDSALDPHPGLDDYLLFAHRALQQMYAVLAPGGVCAVVIGDARKPRQSEPLNLAEEVWRFVKRKRTRFRLAGVIEDRLEETMGGNEIPGERRSGRGALIDRILVLYKEQIVEWQKHVAW